MHIVSYLVISIIILSPSGETKHLCTEGDVRIARQSSTLNETLRCPTGVTKYGVEQVYWEDKAGAKDVLTLAAFLLIPGLFIVIVCFTFCFI